MIYKKSYIGRLSDGKWRVYSKSGKNLGTYRSKPEAKERLAEIEMFKHMDQKKKTNKRALQLVTQLISIAEEETSETYSSVMRDINSTNPEKRKEFMRSFKDAFDRALMEGIDDHQGVALLQAKQVTSSDQTSNLIRFAQVMMAASKSPGEVGTSLARVIKILIEKLPHERSSALETMRNKISGLDPKQISVNTMPETAAYGQSLTLIKTLLNGYSPDYIRQVLSATSQSLY